MDPLTHALVGAAAAHASCGRRLGRTALLIGAGAAVLPDLDVLIRSPADPLLAIEYHRHFTHALAFVPVGAAVAAAPWLVARRYGHRWPWILLAALVAYGTHGLLDAATSFGTLLWWPFSFARVAGHLISILDPLFTLVVAGGVLLATLRRSRGPSWALLALALGYLGAGAVQRERAQAAQAELARSRGHTVARGVALPTVGNHLVWRSLYEAGDTLYLDRVRVPWGGRSQVRPGFAVLRYGAGKLSPAASLDPRVASDLARWRWLTGGWLALDPADPRVLSDARYSMRIDTFEPVWGVRFHPGDAVPTEWVDRSRERRIDLGALWQEILGRGGFEPITTADARIDAAGTPRLQRRISSAPAVEPMKRLPDSR
jgi:inner membrane protein